MQNCVCQLPVSLQCEFCSGCSTCEVFSLDCVGWDSCHVNPWPGLSAFGPWPRPPKARECDWSRDSLSNTACYDVQFETLHAFLMVFLAGLISLELSYGDWGGGLDVM